LVRKTKSTNNNQSRDKNTEQPTEVKSQWFMLIRNSRLLCKNTVDFSICCYHTFNLHAVTESWI